MEDCVQEELFNMNRRYKVVLTDCPFPSTDIYQSVLSTVDAGLVYLQTKNAEAIMASAHDADVVAVGMALITDKIIGRLQKCRAIIRHGIGVDTIDVEAATSKGIFVCNVPDYCVEEVADHTVLLLLACAKKLIQSAHRMRQGLWGLKTVEPVYRLRGRNLGLIGFGRIASEVARKTSVFGLTIAAYDPFLSEDDFKHHKIQAMDFPSLLAWADYVSVHVPLNYQTKGMIARDELKMMKKDAYLINAARGGIVDQSALVEALNEKWIAGAAIDVFEQEPLPKDHPFLSIDNIILTPHVAWYSEEARDDLQRKGAEEVARILKGEKPCSCVNGSDLGK